ncbi:60S ribosomal protein L15 [Massospora cicadina]|nr:60S ribosomal protein L15 [Massospora cicadina]
MRFLLRVRCWEYRQHNTIIRASRPSRPDKARRLGYKDTLSIACVFAAGIVKDRLKKALFLESLLTRVSMNSNQNGIFRLLLSNELESIAVLFVFLIYYEVILVDPFHKAIRRDPRFNGLPTLLTSTANVAVLHLLAKKSRGLGKGHRFNKTIGGSRKASWKRRNTLSLRRYR